MKTKQQGRVPAGFPSKLQRVVKVGGGLSWRFRHEGLLAGVGWY